MTQNSSLFSLIFARRKTLGNLQLAIKSLEIAGFHKGMSQL